MTGDKRAIPPWILAVTAMLAIQFSSALSVGLIEFVGSAGTAWLRLCCGALILWVIARPSLRSIRRKDIPALIALGTATGYMTTFFLAAIERIPLGTAVAIEFLGPLTVAAVSSKDRRALVWPVLALCGVVVLGEPWSGTLDIVGVGYALLAGLGWAVYNLLTQHVSDRFAGITGLSITIPIAAVVTIPVGLPQVLGGDFSWWILLAAAGIALITPVVAFGLEMLSLRRMTHTAYGTLLAVEPAFAGLIGLIVLSQAPSIWQLLGITLVVIAGIAAQRNGARTIETSTGPIGIPIDPPGERR